MQKGLPGCEIDENAGPFGWWRCTLCNSTFYDGPRAVHKPSCVDNMPSNAFDETYRNCIRVREKQV